MTLNYIPAGPDAPIIDSGAAAAPFWREHVASAPEFRPEKEWATTLLLDAGRRLLGHLAPESDGAGAWGTNPIRRMLRAVLLSEAAGVVHVHNHPTGPVTPSDADLGHSHSTAQWLERLGASLFDYVIVGRNGEGWYSFAEAGQFMARAAALQDVRAGTYEAAFESVAPVRGPGGQSLAAAGERVGQSCGRFTTAVASGFFAGEAA